MAGPVFFSTSYTSCKCCYCYGTHLWKLVMLAPKHPTRGFFFPTHTVTMCDHFDFGWVHCFFGPQGVEVDHGKSSEKTGSVDLIIPGTGWFDVENMWITYPCCGQPLKLWMWTVDSKIWCSSACTSSAQADQECEAGRANRAPFFGTLLNLKKVPHGSTQTCFLTITRSLTSINTIHRNFCVGSLTLTRPILRGWMAKFRGALHGISLHTRQQHVRKENCWWCCWCFHDVTVGFVSGKRSMGTHVSFIFRGSKTHILRA